METIVKGEMVNLGTVSPIDIEGVVKKEIGIKQYYRYVIVRTKKKTTIVIE